MSALELKVSARVGDFQLAVELRAAPGITVLFGPSGAGKSTTLAIVAGLRAPDSGQVRLGEQLWADGRRVLLPVHRRGVSLVFQSAALFPHLSARQNVEYGIARDVPRAERQQRALAMLERMKVGHLVARRPRSFSGGEAQRVALARAFAHQPRVLLLDEAFSAMDRELRRELLAEVRTYVSERQLPTILVTHQRGEARAMGDRLVHIEAGRVIAEGTPAELLRGDDD